MKPQDVKILPSKAEIIDDNSSDDSGCSLPEQKSDSVYDDCPSEELNYDWRMEEVEEEETK